MRIQRQFSSATEDIYEAISFCEYLTHDEETIIVPAHWSDAASACVKLNILSAEPIPVATLVQKCDGVPEWLCPRKPDISILETLSASMRYCTETDIRQALNRFAGGVTARLWDAKIFDGEEDARTFFDELRFVILHQMVMPEVALLKTVGLEWAYGIFETTDISLSSVIGRDVSGLSDMCHANTGAGYVADQTGFGAGAILPWLKLFEQAKQCGLDNLNVEQSITSEKSCVFLDVGHPESREFIRFRQKEDEKHVVLSVGQGRLETHLQMIMDACNRNSVYGFDPALNPVLKTAVQNAKRDGVSDGAIQATLLKALNGDEEAVLQKDKMDVCGDLDIANPAFKTTIRLPDNFIEQALMGYDYPLTDVIGDVVGSVNAEDLWFDIAEANWACGDPSAFFTDTVNVWNTCSGDGQIKAMDANGGYTFFAGTSALSAALNITAFSGMDGDFDIAGFLQVTQLTTMMLDTLIPEASDYRNLGIGLTGAAPYLMAQGLPYDGEHARSAMAAISALMTAEVYRTSSLLSEILKPFPRYLANKASVISVLENHLACLEGDMSLYQDSVKRPSAFQGKSCIDKNIFDQAKAIWQENIKSVRQSGLRNAQATHIAEMPIENNLLSMRANGLRPVQEIARFEGFFGDNESNILYGRKLDDCVISGLKALGYGASQIDDIHFYVTGHGSLFDAPAIDHEALKKKGFCQAQFDALEQALKSVMDIRYAFNPWVLGEGFCEHSLGFDKAKLKDPSFDMLTALGFSERDVTAANKYCCGRMTLKDAPHISLNLEHMMIFECELPVEKIIAMMTSVQPFISGSIGQMINVKVQTTVDEVRGFYKNAWESGLKQLSLYREQSGFTNPSVLPMSMVLEPFAHRQAANDVRENVSDTSSDEAVLF